MHASFPDAAGSGDFVSLHLRFRIRCFILVAMLSLPAVASAVGDFRPWTGGATPPLVLNDLDGQLRRLADYRDKVVVINFWASWCEPCRDEIPSLQRLKDQLDGSPFALIAVNMGENAARVHRFLDMMPIDYTVLLDPDMRAAKAWRVHLLPYSFLLDRAHRIRYVVVGEMDWSAADVVQRIEVLMRAPDMQQRVGYTGARTHEGTSAVVQHDEAVLQ